MYEQISILGENIQVPNGSKIKKFEDILKELQQVIEAKNHKIAYLEDKNKKLNSKIQSINSRFSKEQISINSDKARFLIAFIQLYKGNFARFRSINEDAEQKVLTFISNVLYELGDMTFQRNEENMKFYNLEDVKDLLTNDFNFS
ncbi:hypothetical protein Ccar_16725 [Clostridium carboxidivorans P7]|uniref:hypothetical protein n=1 Tax=Clostridium carboxidivorans TaxID=217159 RepID=UPI00064FE7BF|nr:hypothetical protein [Clostridium carboxidivorans]AKN32414.1 hypothetical protein Ccar_16725 [Clostridium carboxidivorans P7]